MMQGKSEQDGKQQHLEYIAAGKGTDDAGRYHIQQEGNYPLGLGLIRIDGDGAGVE